jgi:hypothetical protein
MRQDVLFILLTVIISFGYHDVINAQEDTKTGAITGTVIDKETHNAIIGANVLVIGTKRGGVTDTEGFFEISDLPIGSYVLQITYVGFEPVKVPDVIVRPRRNTNITAEMVSRTITVEEASVTVGYFQSIEYAPTSSVSFGYEEIRRAPGSAGDVSRIIYGLPSIAKVNDQYNGLVVRGGSPIENAFYIDNIEVPNINHFPTQGSSGGAVSVINVDLINNVNFMTGGFASTYGDKLSSVMDINLREGNREMLEGQIELSMAGAGFVAEGPIGAKKGSWMVSLRRSYVDFVVDLMDLGVAPKYGDLNVKLTYDIDEHHKISIIDIGSIDLNHITRDQAKDLDFSVFGDQNSTMNVAGVNWMFLWGTSGYTTTSISHSYSDNLTDFNEGRNGAKLLNTKSIEQSINIRSVSRVRFDKTNSLEFGVEAKTIFDDYRNYFGAFTTATGDSTGSLQVNENIETMSAGAFANYMIRPLPELALSLGFRVDHFSYNRHTHFSPRISVTYALSEITSVNVSFGIFYQNLPMFLLSQSEHNKNLDDPSALHFVVGISHFLTEDTKLTVEAYRKEYSSLPLDPAQPGLFVLDEIMYRQPFFLKNNNLVAEGNAFSQGVEVLVQKKLAKNIYGMASAAYFSSRYEGIDGVWRDRVFNNRYLVSIEGGYKPNNEWEYSARWMYAGGQPYTPFDYDASRAANRAVFDGSRINAANLPDYHSLNIRADKRFHFESSNLVLYLSIWNAYNRRNIASYFWNEFTNEPAEQKQWSVMPILGIEYEF